VKENSTGEFKTLLKGTILSLRHLNQHSGIRIYHKVTAGKVDSVLN